MLHKVLEEISARTPGFRGAAVVGMDGMPLVHLVKPGGPDLDLFSAEYATLLRKLQGISGAGGAGRIQGIATVGEPWNLLVERVNDNYFLLLLVSPEGPVGRGRYELRRAAFQLGPELA